MHVFKHPKYYEEMRRRAKQFQKEQATSTKRQAASDKPQASSKQQAATNCRSDDMSQE